MWTNLLEKSAHSVWAQIAPNTFYILCHIFLVVIIESSSLHFFFFLFFSHRLYEYNSVTSYDRVVDGKALEIQNNANDKIADKQTGREWNFEGMAVNGQLKGRLLMRLPFDEEFALSG
jgi:hypothetical protein